MSSLKERKEDFVSGLAGGSILEIYGVTSAALTSSLLYCLLYRYTDLFHNKNSNDYIYDFLLNWIPLLLSTTTYSSHVDYLTVLCVIPAMLYIAFNKSRKSKSTTTSKQAEIDFLPKKSYITSYRSHMMIITCLSILEVDFPIFPRRFAKVETWGTSLMDLGVGSFVFSMGLVNSRAILKHKYNESSGASSFTKSMKYYGLDLLKSIRSSLPILVLGVIRLISVKGLEYQEHVTEYGVHWNFFFTLGFLPIFLSILNPLLEFFPRYVVGLAVGGIYEYLLAKTDLLSFILSAPRVDLFSSNKEGIWSFVGYLSIFICGQASGLYVLTGYKTPRNLIYPSNGLEINNYKKIAKKSGYIESITVSDTKGLAIFAIFYQTAFLLLHNFYPYTCSRRIANLPYVLWVVSYNMWFLLGYKLIGTILSERSYDVSPILDSINKNGLAIFLIANLGTGLVNMTINTLDCTNYIAMVILVVYALALAVIAVVLDKLGIYIKL